MNIVALRLYPNSIALLLSIFLALGGNHSLLSAQTTDAHFQSDRWGVAFAYPSHWLEDKLAIDSLIVALKAPDTGLPNFNIISVAENYLPETTDLSGYQERIVNDYRQVGITQVSALKTYRAQIAGQQLIASELSYPSNLGELISIVTLIPHLRYGHLVLTYIDKKSTFYQQRHYYDSIVSSFMLVGAAEIPAPPNSSVAYWIISATLLGALLSGIFIFARKWRANVKTP